MSCVNDDSCSKIPNDSYDFDALLDDAMLDDADDDFICSQFNLADIPGIESSTPAKQVQSVPIVTQYQTQPVTSHFQPRSMTPQVRPSPSPFQYKHPLVTTQLRQLPQPSFGNLSVTKELDESVESKLRDKLQGEILWLKDRLKIATKQLDEERKAKQKLYEEKEAALNEFKSDYDKRINNIQSKLDFKEHDYQTLKMKTNELERQLKINQAQLDNHNLIKPLPYSLPIVMHRSLDFTPNKGFIDWDECVTLDDVPD